MKSSRSDTNDRGHPPVAPLAAVLTVACLVSPGTARAQSGGQPFVLRETSASVRAMALGDAYMMDAGHADAIFYHPALLVDAAGFGLEWQKWGEGGEAVAASAAMEWFGGGVGIGLQSVQYQVVPGAGRPGQDVLFETLGRTAAERVALVGYAREVFGLDMGVTAKVAAAQDGEGTDTETLFDVGVATEVGPLRVGLTAQDIGRLPLDPHDGIDPGRVTLGVGGYGQPLGPLDVGLTAAVTYTPDGTWVGGGVEVGYWPINGRTFVARVGVRETADDAAGPFSLGFAFWGDDLVLEAAYRPFPDLDQGTYRVGVRWR